MLKRKWPLFASVAFGLVFVCTVFAAQLTYYSRYVVNGIQIYLLENDGTQTQAGALKFGNNEDNAMTLPTTSTADKFGVKVPFYNASGSALTRGMVVISSGNSTTALYGSAAAVTSTSSILGICDGTVASGAKGWMSVEGYAAVLTTGTVNLGDLLVSTSGSAGAGAAGYAGKIASAATVEAGTVLGKAVSVGTAAGGLTIIRLE